MTRQDDTRQRRRCIHRWRVRERQRQTKAEKDVYTLVEGVRGRGRERYSIQCRVYSVSYNIYSIQYIVYSIEYTVYTISSIDYIDSM